MFNTRIPHGESREDVLGRAFRTLPEPELSADFNDRIHRELQYSSQTVLPYLQVLRRGLCAAAGSFAVTLALLALFGVSGHNTEVATYTGLSTAQTTQSTDIVNPESVMERPDLTSASIRELLSPSSSIHASSAAPLPTAAPLNRATSTPHRLQGA